MPTDNIDISDSVVMGDVQSTTNYYHSESLTCTVCGAKGSIAILTCNNSGCENVFCNYCQDSRYEKICGVCIELEISKLLDGEKRIELARIEAEEKKRNELLLELEEKRKKWNLERSQSNTIIAKIVKARFLSLPLMYIICLYIAYLFIEPKEATMSQTTDWTYGDFTFFGIMQFNLTIIFYNFVIGFDRNNIKKACSGKSPNRAALIAITPIIGCVLAMIVFANGSNPATVMSSLIGLPLAIYVSAKITLK